MKKTRIAYENVKEEVINNQKAERYWEYSPASRDSKCKILKSIS